MTTPTHPSHLVFLLPQPGASADVEWSVPWQRGPVKENGVNGVQAPEVIEQVLQYLRSVNVPPYNSRLTSLAITDLESAQNWLNRRTAEREVRGVEGTATP